MTLNRILSKPQHVVRSVAIGLLAVAFHCSQLAIAAPVDANEASAQEAAAAAVPVPVSMAALTIYVPRDAAITENKGGAQFGDLRFPTFNRYQDDGARRDLLTVVRVSPQQLEIERRVETRLRKGISAKRFRLNYVLEQNDAGYKLTLQPVDSISYRTTWLNPFPVPPFEERDLNQVLMGPTLPIAVEFDSEYNVDSVYANYLRMAQRIRPEGGKADPSTKVLRDEMSVMVRGKRVQFQLQIFPYRNGSKAVITADLPAALTSPNTVDFSVLLNELREKLAAITRA